MELTTKGRRRLIGGATVTATALLFAAGAVNAADPPLTVPFNPACNGAYTPGQLGGLEKTLAVTVTGGVQTVTFTISYPPNTTRSGGRLLDCISIGPDKSGLIASVEDPSDLTSGTFTGTYTVGRADSGADIIVKEGEVVCDVAFLTGNDTGGGAPSGQKTSAPVCTPPIVTPTTTTTTIAPTTTTAAATTTTIAATTTTAAATTTTSAATTTTAVSGVFPPAPSTTALAVFPPVPPTTDGAVFPPVLPRVLPSTGSSSLPTMLLAFGLIAGGGAAILTARRRQA